MLTLEAMPPVLIELEHTVAQWLIQADALMLTLEAKPPELELTVAQRLIQADALMLTLEAKPPVLVELEQARTRQA